VKRAALALVLLTGACAATPTPTRNELAEALQASGAPVADPEDLTHIACEAAAAPGEVACRWRQREGRQWHGWQSHLALSNAGWRLIGAPARRP